jgi:hypothetical protein
MPKGPQGQKRPGDAIGAAVKTMRILTGDESEDRDTDATKKAAGRKGGGARSAKMTGKERSSSASKAAKARWKRD